MAIISPGMRACVLLSVMLFAACNKDNPAAPSATAQSPGAVVININGATPAAGSSAQFTAVAIGADGARTDVTAQATWTSSDVSVLTVVRGMVHAVAPGPAQLTASYAGVTGAMPVIVAAKACTFSVNPTQVPIPAGGGAVSVSVTAVQGEQCPWSAETSGFARIEGPASGAGSGSFIIAADANTGGTRVGTVTVAGTSVTVSQGRTNCVATVSPLTQSVSAQGGTFQVNVTAAAGCDWTIENSSPFITVNGALSRSGTAQVSFQVAPNQAIDARSATIRIDRFELVVTQAAGSGQGGGW